MSEKLIVAPRPCNTCPYRKDTPAGLWHPSEYAKLPTYDEGGASLGVFLCHQTNATGEPTACRGWLTVAADSVAVRLAIAKGDITHEQRDAPVDTPLYASGKAACVAGLKGVRKPSAAARRLAERLLRTRAGKL